MIKSLLAKTLLTAGIAALTSASSWAAFVTWDLNPANLNAPAGSNIHSYTVSGATITAAGFDNVGFFAPHELYFKNVGPINGAVERGLGVTGTYDFELESNPNGTTAQFIQLDLRSILQQGFTGGQIEIGSVQAGESFRLFASNALGELGMQIGGEFGSTFDSQFVSIPNFGSFDFISVAAGSNGDVLPIAFRAVVPVPEVSSLFPIVGLVTALGSTHVLRRRRLARQKASLS